MVDLIVPEHTRPHAWVIAVNALVAAALVGVTVAAAVDRRFAVYFCVAALATLGLFRLAAFVVMRAARLAPASRIPWVRLGVSNLYRPGAATPLLMLSVGLGLATLATVSLIQFNIRQQILEQIPTDAPSFFFVDIQNDQMERFRALANAVPGVSEIKDVPSLRARVVAIKGVPVEQANVDPNSAVGSAGRIRIRGLARFRGC